MAGTNDLRDRQINDPDELHAHHKKTKYTTLTGKE